MAGQVVLLLHGAAEDLLHAAGHHRHRGYDRAQHIVLHFQVCDGPASARKESQRDPLMMYDYSHVYRAVR